VFGNRAHTCRAQIVQDKMRHHPFCNIYNPLQFDMANRWHQLVPENIDYKAGHLKNNLSTIACTKAAKRKVNMHNHTLNSKGKWSLTLNNIARCLQRPTDRLPIGITTDPKQSLRSLLQSLQMETRLSSPTEADPLVTAIKHS